MKQVLPIADLGVSLPLFLASHLNPHSREQHRAASFLRFCLLNSFWQTIQVILALILSGLNCMAPTAQTLEVVGVVCTTAAKGNDVVH